MSVMTENGTTAARDNAYRTLESSARRMLAAGTSTQSVARDTGLSLATVESIAAETTSSATGTAVMAGGQAESQSDARTVTAAPQDAPDADPRPDVEQLLRRAERTDDRRLLTVAARIRHDLDLLAGLLANTAEAKAARRRVEALERKRAALEARIAEAQRELDAVRAGAPAAPSNGIVRPAGSRAAMDPLANSPEVRSWLRLNGYPVAVVGRLSREHLAAYRAAHPEAPGASGADINANAGLEDA